MPRWNRESLVCGRGSFFSSTQGRRREISGPTAKLKVCCWREALFKDYAFGSRAAPFTRAPRASPSDPMGSVSLPATHELQAWTRLVLRKAGSAQPAGGSGRRGPSPGWTPVPLVLGGRDATWGGGGDWGLDVQRLLVWDWGGAEGSRGWYWHVGEGGREG